LPEEVKGIITEEIKNKKENESKQKSMDLGAQFGGYSAGYLGEKEESEVKNDVILVPFEPEEASHVGFERYFVVAELTNKVGSLVTGGQFGTKFYSRPDGSAAHASRTHNSISWNLYAFDSFSRIVEEVINSPGNELSSLHQILNTIIHEIAHVREGGSTTHHVQFYEVQMDNMARLLAEEPAFRSFLKELKEKYAERLENQKDVKEFSAFLRDIATQEVVDEDILLVPNKIKVRGANARLEDSEPQEGKEASSAVDNSMLTRSVPVVESQNQKDVGGIDLNPNMLELQTQGSGVDFDIPIDPQAIQTIQIDGFSPVIFQIVPTNLPMLMGVLEGEEEQQLSLAQ